MSSPNRITLDAIKRFLIVGFLLLTFSGLGQTRTILGRLVDEEDKKPIRNAVVNVAGTTTSARTNFSGFFQLEIVPSVRELILDHLAYESIRIELPAADRFMVPMKKKMLELPALGLDNIGHLASNAINTDSLSKLTTTDAAPTTGPEGFLKELGTEIVTHSSFESQPAIYKAAFGVDAKGGLTVMFVKGSDSTNANIINQALTESENWIPARFVGTAVKQFFTLDLYYGKEKYGAILSDSVFTEVGTDATYPGGYGEFFNFLKMSLRYPIQAQRMGVEGLVIASFVVERDGRLTNYRIEKGIGAGCDEEVLNTISTSERWDPAKVNGFPVRQLVSVEVLFKFQGVMSEKQFQKRAGQKEDVGPSNRVIVTGMAIERSPRTISSTDVISISNRPAQFTGGPAQFVKYLEKNKQKFDDPIPVNGTDDQVEVAFTVMEDGSISNARIVSGLGAPFDSEAIRLCRNMPKWEPALAERRVVAEERNAFINFSRLSQKKKIQANERYDEALNFFQIKDFRSALINVSLAIQDNPTKYEYYLLRSLVYGRLGKNSEACVDLSKIRYLDQEALILSREMCNEEELNAMADSSQMVKPTSREEIFTRVDTPAKFPGGISAFYEFMSQEMNYPKEAKRKGVEGRVFLSFIVEKDGSLSDIKVAKGIGAGCDEEAVRILENSPNWIPGSQKGRPVRQKMIQNILFKL